MTHRRTAVLAAIAACCVAYGPAFAAPAGAATRAVNGWQPLSAVQAAAMSGDADTPVIVVMRDQPTPAARDSAQAKSRTSRIRTAQAPVVSELSRLHARGLRQFQTTDAVAATVSKVEAARLADDPDVAAVVPDERIQEAVTPAAPMAGVPPVAGAATPATAAQVPGVCPAPGAPPLLEPEALTVTHTDSADPSAKTARSLGFTGTGVKIGDIADGFDVDNADLTRADGSRVYAGYQDFSAEGKDAVTGGGESFLDGSVMAAQGILVHDVSRYTVTPPQSQCDVRLEGMSPGVSLYGYKVFGENDYATTSALLQSIDWAASVDHVDVLAEPFGYTPFADSATADVVKMFNDDAVAEGVTVVTAAGDAGPTSTQWSPSTDPKVIAMGASTTFRSYLQSNRGGADTFAHGGWINDNISSASGGGFNQSGRTIDLVAPGDLSFETCTPDLTRFLSCKNLLGQPTDVELHGGTSEAAPLAASTAALVIQAYRQSHGGASPTPAQIKDILMGTADDLGAPADEQGAGLLDSYRAVLAATSLHDDNGSPARVGATVLTDQTQLDATQQPGSTVRWRVRVTNNGAAAQTVRLSGRTFGTQTSASSGSVTFSDTDSPHFVDQNGTTENYGLVTFNVPAHSDRLAASIAFPNAQVKVMLIDPLGRLAAYSLPQGDAHSGAVDVRDPTEGTWTAVLSSLVSTAGGATGAAQFQESTEIAVPFGTVSPPVLHLAPGASAAVTVTATVPHQAGDTAASLVLDAGAGGRSSVPIVVRSLVDLDPGPGTFAGRIIASNGRMTDAGQGWFFQFDVRKGLRNIAASVDLANDAGDTVAVYLIDPEGQVVGWSTNQLTTGYDLSDRTGTATPVTQTDVYARDPAPGRWTLTVNVAGAVVGDELSQQFSGHIGVNTVDVAAPGLLDSAAATLPAGRPTTVPVTVHNTGTAPEDFFLDPRLDRTADLALAPVESGTVTVPLPGSEPSPTWLVPSETSSVTVDGRSTEPVMFDMAPETGDPDVLSSRGTATPTATVAGRPVQPGLWSVMPSPVGATPTAVTPTTATFGMVARTQPFDTSATSPATDLWLDSTTPLAAMRLVTIQPGQSAVLPLTIIPAGARGTTVRGTVYVDQLAVGQTPVVNSLNMNDLAPTEPTANDLVGLPYQYTIN